MTLASLHTQERILDATFHSVIMSRRRRAVVRAAIEQGKRNDKAYTQGAHDFKAITVTKDREAVARAAMYAVSDSSEALAYAAGLNAVGYEYRQGLSVFGAHKAMNDAVWCVTGYDHDKAVRDAQLKDMHHGVAVSAIKAGEYVRLVPNGPVWIRGGYDRSTKAYCLTSFNDCNKELMVKGAKIVFIGFTF